MKMHDGEIDIDAGLVARLIAAQFPGLDGLSARDLAKFLTELRQAPVAEAPRAGRYVETNPGFATLAKRRVEQVLADVIT
jgi:hypothetical protein